MKSPLNINILPTDSEAVKAVKQKLNDHIKRVDECYRLLRSDVAALGDVDDIEIPTLIDDHGDLNGLEDDDHSQYILADGTRDYTGTGEGFKDEDDMASDSPVATASQQSIKAYVDSLINSLLADILAAPIGSVIYIWEDGDGNKQLEFLPPDVQGKVLHDGGGLIRPYWDLTPVGANPTYWWYVVIESTHQTALVTMDKSAQVDTDGMLTAIVGTSQGGPNSGWFRNYDPVIESEYAAALQSIDHSSLVENITNNIDIQASGSINPEITAYLEIGDI